MPSDTYHVHDQITNKFMRPTATLKANSPTAKSDLCDLLLLRRFASVWPGTAASGVRFHMTSHPVLVHECACADIAPFECMHFLPDQ